MNLNNSLTYLFAEISNQFWVSLEKSMLELGVHSGQVFVLISLWGEDAQSQKDLANKLNLSPPTINKMIKSLERNNLVKTKRDQSDSRKVRVYLTDKGKNIQQPVIKQWIKLEENFFFSLSATEMLIAQQVLEKLKKGS